MLGEHFRRRTRDSAGEGDEGEHGAAGVGDGVTRETTGSRFSRSSLAREDGGGWLPGVAVAVLPHGFSSVVLESFRPSGTFFTSELADPCVQRSCNTGH